MKKIMFNDKYGLTKAVLAETKTVTRRIAYDFRKHTSHMVFRSELLPSGNITYMDGEQQVIDVLPKPHYEVGEVVAIAQNYKEAGCDFYFHRGLAGWTNKMFVRAEEMPHRIRITNFRVERLQDISDEDCLKEGIKRKNGRYRVENEKGVEFYTNSPILAFRCLIDKVCGKGTWKSNPWVYAYDFKLIKK